MEALLATLIPIVSSAVIEIIKKEVTVLQAQYPGSTPFQAVEKAIEKLFSDSKITQEIFQKVHLATIIAKISQNNADLVKSVNDSKFVNNLREFGVHYDTSAIIAALGNVGSADRENLAKAIRAEAFKLEPTGTIQGIVQSNKVLRNIAPALKQDVASVLSKLPSDAITHQPMGSIAVNNPAAMADVPIERQPAVTVQLKKLARVNAIAPTTPAFQALLNNNLTTSVAIASIPKASFIASQATAMTSNVAAQVHSNAVHATIHNESTLITLLQMIQGTGLQVIDGKDSAALRVMQVQEQIAAQGYDLNIENLFGSMDQVLLGDDDVTVYSPSAYFVDLLNFLRNNNFDSDTPAPDLSVSGQASIIKGTVLEQLFLRRPDLGNLELTGPNTNVVLPYIDLANEVMESFLVNLGAYSVDPDHQATIEAFNVTTEDTEELLAQPQNINIQAYRALASAVDPFSLPYHLPIETERVFLEFLQVPRSVLVDAFRHRPPVITSGLEVQMRALQRTALDRQVTSETLGFVQEEFIILCKEAFFSKDYFQVSENIVLTDVEYQGRIGVKPTSSYWGYASMDDLLSRDATLQSGLQFVKKQFLPRSGISFVDLVEIVQTKFINPNYPNGRNKTILDEMKFSYAFLQTLVDYRFTEPSQRYGRLAEFLIKSDSAISLSRLLAKTTAETIASTTTKRNCSSSDEIKNWVFNHFASIGQVIVLDWNQGPTLSVTGIVIATVSDGSPAKGVTVLPAGKYGTLGADGWITDSSGRKLANVTINGQVMANTQSLNSLYPQNSFTVLPPTSSLAQSSDASAVAFITGGYLKTPNSDGVASDIVQWLLNPGLGSGSTIDSVTLTHLDGTPLSEVEWDKMHCFIRLWHKLAWSVNEVDMALAGFSPAPALANSSTVTVPSNGSSLFIDDAALITFDDYTDSVSTTNGQAISPAVNSGCDMTVTTLVQLAAVFNLLPLLSLPVEKLLTFWTDIPTAGDDSLYSRLFFTGNLKSTDPTFGADENGDYFTSVTPAKLTDNQLVVMAAFRIKAVDLTFLLGLDPNAQPQTVVPDVLNIKTLSAIYRTVLLARALGVTVYDLSQIFEGFGNPFLSPVDCLNLLQTWNRMKGADFPWEQLRYIVDDVQTPLDPLAPDEKTVLLTSKSIYDGVLQVEAKYPMVDDPADATPDLLKAQLELVFDGATVSQILGLLGGTTVYATRAPIILDSDFPAQVAAVSSKLAYIPSDGTTGAQLHVTGILTASESAQAKGLLDFTPLAAGKTQTKQDRLIADWKSSIDRAFTQAQNVYLQTISGIFGSSTSGSGAQDPTVIILDGDLPDDIATPPTIVTPNATVQSAAVPQHAQSNGISKQSSSVNTKPPSALSNGVATRSNPTIAKANLVNGVKDPIVTRASQTKTTLLPQSKASLSASTVNGAQDTAVANADPPGQTGNQKRFYFLQSFVPYLQQKLARILILSIISSAVGFEDSALAKVVLEHISPADQPSESIIDYLLSTLKNPNADPTKWSGFIVVPTSDNYTFFLTSDSTPYPIILDGAYIGWTQVQEDPERVWSTKAVALNSANLYTLTLNDIDPSTLFWKSSLAKTAIPSSAFLPDFAHQETYKVFEQLQKIAILVNNFKLSSDEVIYIHDHANDFSALSFTGLSMQQWERVQAYVALRDSLPQKTTLSLVNLFNWSRNNPTGTTDDLATKIAAATLWNKNNILQILERVNFSSGLPGDFQNEIILLRIQQLISIASKIGIDIPRLFTWAAPLGTSTKDFYKISNVSQDIQTVARSKSDLSTWPDAVKPLNDTLRESRKNALIAYLLIQDELRSQGITDADSLFEFFLIDVQMTPLVETSRIKQAIATVQVFVQRCILGLEPAVNPGSLDIKRWDWMKLYRLWEANRKVFLYPENWITPSLRDNKTDFFKQLESTFLQRDLSQDVVATALKTFVFSLNQISSLAAVALYAENHDGGATSQNDKIHVFARTTTAPYAYYYIWYLSGVWSAWQKMDIEIPSYTVALSNAQDGPSGTYMAPIVYGGRLLVFIPQFMKKSIPSSAISSGKNNINQLGGSNPLDLQPQDQWEIKMSWTELQNGKWMPRQVCDIGALVPYSVKVDSFQFIPATVTQDHVSSLPWYTAQGLRIYATRTEFPNPNPSDVGAWDFSNGQLTFLGETTRPLVAPSTLDENQNAPPFSNPQPIVRPAGDGTPAASDTSSTSWGITTTTSPANTPPQDIVNTTYGWFSDWELHSYQALDMPGNQTILTNISYVPYITKLSASEPKGTIMKFGSDGNLRPQLLFNKFCHPLMTLATSSGDIMPIYTFLGNLSTTYNTPDPGAFINTISLDSVNGRPKLAVPGISPIAAIANSVTFPKVTDVVLPDPATSTIAAVANSVTFPKVTDVVLPDPATSSASSPEKATSPAASLVASPVAKPALLGSPGEEIESIDGVLGSSAQPRLPGVSQPRDAIMSPEKATIGRIQSLLAIGNADIPAVVDMDEAFGRLPESSGSFSETATPYSVYNWEIGLHAPMMLIENLLAAQQFDQALDICHYVFNPMAEGDKTDMTRFWVFAPFKMIRTQTIESFFMTFKSGESRIDVKAWRNSPFQPFVVARSRPMSFMKWIVMKYIEILIAYGDYYFRQNTLETIPNAIQMYILASHLYGPRGNLIPRQNKIKPATWNDLSTKFDAFSNAMVQLEETFPFSNQTPLPVGKLPNDPGIQLANMFGSAGTLYFAIPDNPTLRALGSTIDDRLFKIRHSQDINGIFRSLPLFEPPIDPALLVQAAGQGLSLSSVLADISGPMPNYRFQYLLSKAIELCSEVKSLGNALVSACEKQDFEALSSLRAKYDTATQTSLMSMKKLALDDANASLDTLEYSRKGPVNRLQYYLQQAGEDLSGVPSIDKEFQELNEKIQTPVDQGGLKLIPFEQEEMNMYSEAYDLGVFVAGTEAAVGIAGVIPSFTTNIEPIGLGESISFGGGNIAAGIQAVARAMSMGVEMANYQASSAGRKAVALRQLQDRLLQANAAGYEVSGIDKQITASKIRIAMASREIELQQQQIDQTQEIEDFLRSKYSNADLYSWMAKTSRSLFYDTYTQAYDLAKKAEKAFKFERPKLANSSFIDGGYWDPARDGLFSGERLYASLKALETAYMNERGYDYEITKSISLRQIDPMALLRLRETGATTFSIPEVIFDMDFPGHYLRRMKSVSVSIPCIVGPYTNVNCTVRLTSHKYRVNPSSPSSYPESSSAGASSDDRFSTSNIPISAIAVSSGQNDSGVFELSFGADRYMPFEGAGAISEWSLALPPHADFRQFKYETITDVILQMRYTSIDGGDGLKTGAMKMVSDYIKYMDYTSASGGLLALFDLKNEFASEWTRMIKQSSTAVVAGAPAPTPPTMMLADINERLPIFTAGKTPEHIMASDIWILTDVAFPGSEVLVTPDVGEAVRLELEGADRNGLQCYSAKVDAAVGSWNLVVGGAGVGGTDGEKVEVKKAWMVIRYALLS